MCRTCHWPKREHYMLPAADLQYASDVKIRKSKTKSTVGSAYKRRHLILRGTELSWRKSNAQDSDRRIIITLETEILSISPESSDRLSTATADAAGFIFQLRSPADGSVTFMVSTEALRDSWLTVSECGGGRGSCAATH